MKVCCGDTPVSPTPLLLALLLFAWALRAGAQPPDCPPNGDADVILRCEENRLAAANQALDQRYRAVVRALHDDPAPDAQAALRTLINAQRQWIAYRDDDCDAVYLAHHAASLRERHRLRCKTAHAEMRARQLGAYDND